MKNRNDHEVLKLLWQERLFPAGEVHCTAGERIVADEPGEWDDPTGMFLQAGVRINDLPLRGDVLAGYAEQQSKHYDRVILQLVDREEKPVSRADGSLVPQLIIPVPQELAEYYDHLTNRIVDCGGIFAKFDPLVRTAMITHLLVERLRRKHNDLLQIHNDGKEDWNETLHVMLFRTMGDTKNKEAFTQLAQRVPHRIVSHERGSLLAVEALLLGGSGLLEQRAEDEYILALKREFDHLQNKYNITPLRPAVWNLANIQPYNAPVLRLAQLAAFLCSRDFIFDKVVSCRSANDVLQIFSAEASNYWMTHFSPGRISSFSPKRIGEGKAYLLGINFVVPMIFAYGDYTGDEKLREAALSLLEQIPCERNRYIYDWAEQGVEMRNAFDSQAMLQLSREYCEKGRCAACSLGKKAIREKFYHLVGKKV